MKILEVKITSAVNVLAVHEERIFLLMSQYRDSKSFSSNKSKSTSGMRTNDVRNLKIHSNENRDGGSDWRGRSTWRSDSNSSYKKIYSGVYGGQTHIHSTGVKEAKAPKEKLERVFPNPRTTKQPKTKLEESAKLAHVDVQKIKLRTSVN